MCPLPSGYLETRVQECRAGVGQFRSRLSQPRQSREFATLILGGQVIILAHPALVLLADRTLTVGFLLYGAEGCRSEDSGN